MKRIFIIALVSIGLMRCTDATEDVKASDALTIRTGTSFGMCASYCLNEYTFTGTSVTLTQSGLRTQAQNPTKTCQATLSVADWNALKALADVNAFSKLPKMLGCPDCADGGAEYVELQTGDQQYRVTFEYSKTIPGFEPLVEALRKQRAAFPACN